MTNLCKITTLLLLSSAALAQTSRPAAIREQYRPQFHVTPNAHWMNDPNGMFFYKGTYHLFFQYYPYGTVWGGMHWGHTTSKDLVHWQEQPIALYPDKKGWIFSGSVVIDEKNTSGFGKNGQIPLVAVFTQHDSLLEKQGSERHQYQSIAYSLDDGQTWTKYADNPVLQNPGIRDFRDPKVRWYAPLNKWIMTLATKDRVTFYSSANLKNWTKESEFGQAVGAHGGVWECPDLVPLDYGGKKAWVLIVSVNPGGPNGGSAAQYFVGDFDGHQFKPYSTSTKWMDYGTDDYAGVTFSNTGDRTIFMGWMSNWQYATVVPTGSWRSAMTVPRTLSLAKVGDEWLVSSKPVAELDELNKPGFSAKQLTVTKQYDLTPKTTDNTGLFRLEFTLPTANDFTLVLSNDAGNEVRIGYQKQANQYFIDRTRSGNVSFEKDFAKRHVAPRLAKDGSLSVTLLADVASAELFADNGLTTMTDIYFPEKPLTHVRIETPGSLKVANLTYVPMQSARKPGM